MPIQKTGWCIWPLEADTKSSTPNLMGTIEWEGGISLN